eukprot:9200653-Pyramimonas_sp.AAC.1
MHRAWREGGVFWKAKERTKDKAFDASEPGPGSRPIWVNYNGLGETTQCTLEQNHGEVSTESGGGTMLKRYQSCGRFTEETKQLLAAMYGNTLVEEVEGITVNRTT